jgi:hypothetical protein
MRALWRAVGAGRPLLQLMRRAFRREDGACLGRRLASIDPGRAGGRPGCTANGCPTPGRAHVDPVPF